VEISQTAAGHQATHVADGRSLWDKAYDSLKTEEHDRIAAYESLLSRVPTGSMLWLVPDPKFRRLTRDIVQAIAATTSHETADRSKVANQIPQHDVIARREKLKQIAELGLKHMEDKKVSATLLGHEVVLQDVVANVAGAVENSDF
jgi:hypothetical protein